MDNGMIMRRGYRRRGATPASTTPNIPSPSPLTLCSRGRKRGHRQRTRRRGGAAGAAWNHERSTDGMIVAAFRGLPYFAEISGSTFRTLNGKRGKGGIGV